MQVCQRPSMYCLSITLLCFTTLVAKPMMKYTMYCSCLCHSVCHACVDVRSDICDVMYTGIDQVTHSKSRYTDYMQRASVYTTYTVMYCHVLSCTVVYCRVVYTDAWYMLLSCSIVMILVDNPH